jgi:probable blue pigment (indigoidine) exporter
VLAVTAWQLIAGGILLVPAALMAEGAPPALGAVEIAAFAYVGLVATALAFVAWFSGLARLPAGTVGLIGLMNPVTGVILGVLIAGETLGTWQVAGLGLVLAGILLGQPAAARLLDRLTRRARRSRLRPSVPGGPRPATASIATR